MQNPNQPLTIAEARHLVRRLTFGIPAKDGKKFRVENLTGLTRAEAADLFVTFNPKGFRPKGSSGEASHNKWIKFMMKVKGGLSLGEKLTVFLHDHFATNFSTLDAMFSEKDAIKMLAEQNRTLRKTGMGNFKDLVKAINLDPAMMSFLNTDANSKIQPNENYARELLELFTLGVKDLNGNDNYTEPDIAQIARAFTGWVHDVSLKSVFLEEEDHDFSVDYPERGAKEIFATVGGFGGAQSFTVGGEGANEIDEVTEIIFQHADSDGENTVARHLTYKLLSYFAYPDPEKAFVDDVIAAASFVGTWELRELIRAMVADDRFYTTMGSPTAPGAIKSVRHPVDFVVGTLRSLNIKPKGQELQLQGGGFDELIEYLADMGQIVFEPPSVFGWDWEGQWISSVGLLARYSFARDIIASRTKKRFRPDKLIDDDLTDPGEIVDAVTDHFGITDQFTSTERQVLIDYVTDDGAVISLDLKDFNTVNEKLHGLFGLVLQSPQYMVH